MKKWMKRKNYTAQSKKHLRDKNLQEAAKVLSLMEVDDAVDVLEEMDATTKHKIVGMLDKEASDDVRLLFSYDDDVIGSRMTTNFIMIHNHLTIRQRCANWSSSRERTIISRRSM